MTGTPGADCGLGPGTGKSWLRPDPQVQSASAQTSQRPGVGMDGKWLLPVGLVFPETPFHLDEDSYRWLVLLFFVFKETRGMRVWLIVKHLYFGGFGFELSKTRNYVIVTVLTGFPPVPCLGDPNTGVLRYPPPKGQSDRQCLGG